jgi:hypothetical protein
MFPRQFYMLPGRVLGCHYKNFAMVAGMYEADKPILKR